MTPERFTLRAAVFLLAIKDNQTLLLRRRNTGWRDGYFDLVAGHIDGNESLIDALIREAKEEVGLVIAPEDVKFVHLSHTQFDNEYFTVFFEVTKWVGEPKIMEPHHADRLQWFPLDDLPENLTPSSALGLAGYQKHTLYSESGFGPK